MVSLRLKEIHEPNIVFHLLTRPYQILFGVTLAIQYFFMIFNVPSPIIKCILLAWLRTYGFVTIKFQ